MLGQAARILATYEGMMYPTLSASSRRKFVVARFWHQSSWVYGVSLSCQQNVSALPSWSHL